MILTNKTRVINSVSEVKESVPAVKGERQRTETPSATAHLSGSAVLKDLLV